jgi:integrase
MKLVERGGYYYISLYDKKRKRSRRIATGIKVGKDERRYAAAKMKELERKQKGAFYNSLPGKAKLFSEGYAKYKELKRDLGESTFELKDLAYNKFIEVCGNRFIGDYVLEDFERFRNKFIEEGKSVNTANIRTKDIRAIFNFFLQHEWIDKNYAVVQKPHYKKPKSISEAEWRALMDEANARSPKFARIINFMRWTGLRAGEAVDLTWDRVIIDREPPVLLLYNKNHKDEEYCLLLPQAVKILEEIKPYSEQYASASVFGYKSKRLVSFTRFQEEIWGEVRYTPHHLRKTYITYLFNLGLDISDVRVFSRHSTKSMEILVEHYRDIQDRALVQKAIDKEKEAAVKKEAEKKISKLKKKV